MKTQQKKILGVIAAVVVIAGLLSLFPLLDERGSGPATVDAQVQAGYSTRFYLQPPNDALAGVRGAESLSYLYGFNGATFDRMRVQSKITPVSLGAGTTETTIWTPQSGRKFRLMGFVLNASAGTLLTFKDNTAGTTIFTLTVPANVPTQITPDLLGNGYLSATINNVLTVTRGTSAALDGFLVGQENLP